MKLGERYEENEVKGSEVCKMFSFETPGGFPIQLLQVSTCLTELHRNPFNANFLH